MGYSDNKPDIEQKSRFKWFIISNSSERPYLRFGMLRALREALGWTQEQMVAKIQKYSPSGTPDLKTYQRWEGEETQPHQKNCLALEQALRSLGLGNDNHWSTPDIATKPGVDVQSLFECCQRNDFLAALWSFDGLKGEKLRWVLVSPRGRRVALVTIAERDILQSSYQNVYWPKILAPAEAILRQWEQKPFESNG